MQRRATCRQGCTFDPAALVMARSTAAAWVCADLDLDLGAVGLLHASPGPGLAWDRCSRAGLVAHRQGRANRMSALRGSFLSQEGGSDFGGGRACARSVCQRPTDIIIVPFSPSPRRRRGPRGQGFVVEKYGGVRSHRRQLTYVRRCMLDSVPGTCGLRRRERVSHGCAGNYGGPVWEASRNGDTKERVR